MLNPVRTVSLTFVFDLALNHVFLEQSKSKIKLCKCFACLIPSSLVCHLLYGLFPPTKLFFMVPNDVSWIICGNATNFYVLAYKNQHVLLMYPVDVAATWVPCHLPLWISVLFRCSMRAPFLFLSLFNYCISDFLSSASHYDFVFLISTYFIGFLVCLQSSYMSASLVAFFFFWYMF